MTPTIRHLSRFSRRQALAITAAGTLTQLFSPVWGNSPASVRMATFASDITPPLGHPLCGGWIKPAEVIDDPLQGRGLILIGDEAPVVLLSLDWCELNNQAHLHWRQALAKVAHTTPDRVAIQCIHPHNAPLADSKVEQILSEKFHRTVGLDLKFFEQAVDHSAQALQAALAQLQPVTHLGRGQAQVHQVASNRRILGPDGKIRSWRGSATKDERLHDEPEGLIDPWLRTISFWNGEIPLAALSYYATHPMSYYGDGRVNPDFAGYARNKRQADQPTLFQMYFNGCGGNVAPGKYNDGRPANRPLLRDRLYDAMLKAWQTTQRTPLTHCRWRTVPLTLDIRKDPSFAPEYARKLLAEGQRFDGNLGHAAMKLAWADRRDRPIDLTCLDLGQAQILHLPGEPFVEYQLFAQSLKKDGFVCVAGYGDGGPGYIPTERAYSEGGYETGVAYTGPGSEHLLKAAMESALKSQ